MGIIKEETKEVNLNADKKQFWLGRIENMNEELMNESMPITFNHMKNV